MDCKKVGSFISELRKEKGMTQQELGNKLNVTNKAVSKWEIGDGYPEITTIPALVEILGVTTSELLNGERKSQAKNNSEDALIIINETIKSVNKVTKMKKSKIVFVTLSAAFLVASFVCMLCDYVLNKSLSWSLYPLGGMAVAGLTILPLISINKHRMVNAISVFTFTMIPYLFLIEYLTSEKGWVIPLALPIAIISVVAFFIVVSLLVYTKMRKLYIAAVAVFIFGAGINMGVTEIVGNFVTNQQDTSMIVTLFASIFVACILGIFGYVKEARSIKV